MKDIFDDLPIAIGVKTSNDYPEDWGLPQYATEGAACVDLRAIVLDSNGLPTADIIKPNESQVFRTGLFLEIPKGYVLLLYGRSGLAFNNDTRLGNCTGVIDSDFRGEVMIKLTNDKKIISGYSQLRFGNNDVIITHGDRIAQAMLVEIPKMAFVSKDFLEETMRGIGGMGSTGL